jgi:predicted dehydrogenase
VSLRVGVLGTGNIAARHLDAAQVIGLTLVAACGRDEAQAAAFGERFRIRAYTDFERFLGESGLDLLIVGLLHDAHNGQVERAAAAGVNLLVEKPIALDLGRAREMVEASAGVVAACSFMYRFGEAVERWAALTAESRTGPVGHFAGSFHGNALHAPWWRDRARSAACRSHERSAASLLTDMRYSTRQAMNSPAMATAASAWRWRPSRAGCSRCERPSRSGTQRPLPPSR